MPERDSHPSPRANSAPTSKYPVATSSVPPAAMDLLRTSSSLEASVELSTIRISGKSCLSVMPYSSTAPGSPPERRRQPRLPPPSNHDLRRDRDSEIHGGFPPLLANHARAVDDRPAFDERWALLAPPPPR